MVVKEVIVEPLRLDPEVEALLAAANLPVSDLREARGLRLFGARKNGRLIGVVGVEVYGAVGLLRSLAVADAHRAAGYGRALACHAEAWAFQQGVKALYLLTATAAGFFAELGYQAIPRSEAPPVIAATSQFVSLCPASAIFMRKVPRPDNGGRS